MRVTALFPFKNNSLTNNSGNHQNDDWILDSKFHAESKYTVRISLICIHAYVKNEERIFTYTGFIMWLENVAIKQSVQSFIFKFLRFISLL
jgi:hypothetical protein